MYTIINYKNIYYIYIGIDFYKNKKGVTLVTITTIAAFQFFLPSTPQISIKKFYFNNIHNNTKY